MGNFADEVSLCNYPIDVLRYVFVPLSKTVSLPNSSLKIQRHFVLTEWVQYLVSVSWHAYPNTQVFKLSDLTKVKIGSALLQNLHHTAWWAHEFGFLWVYY
jgi:hypothetical protein